MTPRIQTTPRGMFGQIKWLRLCVVLFASSRMTLLALAHDVPAPTQQPPAPATEPQPIPQPPAAPADQPSEPEQQPAMDDPSDPEAILNAALDAMDQAAVDLENDSATSLAVQDQELAIKLIQKLLTASQSPSNSPKPEPSDQLPSSDGKQDQQSSGTNASSNGSKGRRADDENSQESSENVAGPSESGTSALVPKARTNSVWGHLPRREQESLLRSLSDHFIPEYETQIKRYYEALAEGKQSGGGR